jgi:hypothetical protein
VKKGCSSSVPKISPRTEIGSIQVSDKNEMFLKKSNDLILDILKDTCWLTLVSFQVLFRSSYIEK